jgi:hypothetical protein
VAARGTLAVPLNILYGLVDNPNANRQHTFQWRYVPPLDRAVVTGGTRRL